MRPRLAPREKLVEGRPYWGLDPSDSRDRRVWSLEDGARLLLDLVSVWEPVDQKPKIKSFGI